MGSKRKREERFFKYLENQLDLDRSLEEWENIERELH